MVGIRRPIAAIACFGRNPHRDVLERAIYAMQKDGPLSVGIGWNQHIPGPDILVVPKGSKNKDAAMQFIAIAASLEGQAGDVDATACNTPINSEAVPCSLKKDMLPFLPLSYRKQEVPADLEYWAKNVDEIERALILHGRPPSAREGSECVNDHTPEARNLSETAARGLIDTLELRRALGLSLPA